ncbi:MAG: hypothetical protein ACFE8N_16085, partial [Promethearchaeota archaeon]
EYPNDVKLIISIDKGENDQVLEIAKKYSWRYGDKEVIYQDENLGLKSHILKCGDLTKKYDSIILLEDDLYVSSKFYKYTLKALSYYKESKKIAGISLYAKRRNFLSKERPYPLFDPIPDDSDVFFLQIPESWGQVWIKDQWTAFRDWLNYYNSNETLQDINSLPPFLLSWPDSSWAKYFWAYMVHKNRYFVYPRVSFTTQFSELGVHTKHKSTIYQVPLQNYKTHFIFNILDNSLAVYDSFFEILPEKLNKMTKIFKDYNYEVDLNGLKDISWTDKDYLLTVKICRDYLFSFGNELKPSEQNVIEGIKGNDIFFAKRESVLTKPKDPKFSSRISKRIRRAISA